VSFYLQYIFLPFLPFAVGAWLLVLRLLSRKSGWADLAEVYGRAPSGAFGNPSARLAEVHVGTVRYASALHLSTSAGGLAMVGWGAFRPWHSPVFVPIDELEVEPIDAVRVEGWERILAEGDYVRLTPHQLPDVPIHMKASLARHLQLVEQNRP